MTWPLYLDNAHPDDLAMFGEALASHRLAKKISGTDLAEAAGVSRQMLCGLEKGRTAPSVMSLSRILEALEEEYQVTDRESVIWSEYELVLTRYSRYRLVGQHLPVGGVVTTPETADHGYIQILDWR